MKQSYNTSHIFMDKKDRWEGESRNGNKTMIGMTTFLAQK